MMTQANTQMGRIFVLGATGLIGGHAAAALVTAGHGVSGLARSNASVRTLRAAGIVPVPGDVDDHVALQAGIDDADTILFAPSLGEAEGPVVDWMLDRLEGTAKSFIFCSGTGVVGQRTQGAWSEDTFAEDDPFTPPRSIASRVEIEAKVRAASARGLARGMVVRPPAVWTHDRPHFIVTDVVASVHKTGTACFIGQGLNMYSHIHAQDLGDVFRNVVERGQDGAVYHAVGGEVPNRWIAETVARIMGCGTRSITMDEAIDLWGKFATLIVFGASSRSRSPRTRREFDWAPVHTDMLAAAEISIRAMLEPA